MEDGKYAGTDGILDVPDYKQQRQGTIAGALRKRQMNEPIINHIDVDSVDKYSEKVHELGGKIVKPKTEVPGFWGFAICVNTENNSSMLWEQNPQAMR